MLEQAMSMPQYITVAYIGTREEPAAESARLQLAGVHHTKCPCCSPGLTPLTALARGQPGATT